MPTTEGPLVRIQNGTAGTFLYEDAATGVVHHGAVPADEALSQWQIEPYQGTQRLRNAGTGHYLSIEFLREYVEALPVEPVWMSPPVVS